MGRLAGTCTPPHPGWRYVRTVPSLGSKNAVGLVPPGRT